MTLTINQPIRLRDESGAEYASRVEAHEGASLTLARPLDLPASSELGEGSRIEVTWTAESGVFRLPVRVVAATTEGAVRLWHAEVVGPPVREQRRSHVRVTIEQPATLRLEDGSTVRCMLADVSEAAVRCRFETDAAGSDTPALTPGDDVQIAFTLGGVDFAHTARVYRATAADDGTDLVLMLEVDERAATQLRRALFAEQVRLRSLFQR